MQKELKIKRGTYFMMKKERKEGRKNGKNKKKGRKQS
jgi:hypothetical protein